MNTNVPGDVKVRNPGSKKLKDIGVGRAEEPGAPPILWQCQLIPCSRQEARTAISPKLGLHHHPALCPEVLAAQRFQGR